MTGAAGREENGPWSRDRTSRAARLLLVEDDPPLADVVTACLESLGHEVVAVAGTAEQAVALEAEKTPDLVLMDISLPGAEDGIEAARRISLRDLTPVVFLTGLSDDQVLERAEAVSPYGYLLKPFRPTALAATVRMALRRAALERQVRESEARFRSVVEGSRDTILLLDPGTGAILGRNPALNDLLGGPSSDVSTIDGILAAGEGGARREVERALSEARSSFVKRRDGTYLEVEVTAHVVPWGGGEAVCLFLRELTGRSRASEAILRAKVEWEQTFDAIPDLVSILDLDHRIVRLNRALADAFGLSPEKAVGLPCWTLAHPGEGGPPGECPHTAFLASGRTTEAEVVLGPPPGRTYLETIAALRGRDGELVGSVRVAREITEMRRAQEELRLRERFLHELNDVTAAALATSDLAPLYQIVADGLRKLFGAAIAFLALWDEGKMAAAVVAVSGVAPPGLVGVTTPSLSRSLTGDALRGGQPIVSDDFRQWPTLAGMLEGVPVGTVAAIPLAARQPIGSVILVFGRTHPLTPSELSLAGAAARQISLALEKARLFQEMREQAVTDPLTGLRNRRGFLDLARREVDRALRFRRPLAALVLDIDLFKDVNDRLGHAAGDEVLKGVAARLQSVVREVDVIGRPGGDEFSVVLPECDGATGLEIAERIRRVVAAAPLETRRGAVGITVSVGIGLLSPPAHDAAGLLEVADQALYEAKKRGRDLVAFRTAPH